MIVIFFLLIAGLSNADVVELAFPKNLKSYRFQNIYDSNPLKHPLSVWRRLEIDKKYNDCVKKGPSLIANNKKLSGWIFNIWSICVYKATIENFDQKVVLNFFNNVKIQSTQGLNGPWRNSTLLQIQKVIGLAIAEIEKNANNSSNYIAKKGVKKNARKDSQQNAKLKSSLLSLLEMDEAYQNAEIKKWFQTEIDSNQPSLSPVVKVKPTNVSMDSTEPNPMKRIQTLDDYINGDTSRAIVQIEPILDSLKSIYRKMDYRKIADFAPKLESLYRNSDTYRDFAMLMGRSFQFIGEYHRSLDFFKTVIDYYPESIDFEEALFRSGLIHLRQGQYQQAQKFFERLVLLGRDRYDITGRYWWLRTLQYNKDPRELEEKNRFAVDFPFSYFGLRITAELNNGKIISIQGADMPALKWTITGKNAEVWKRFIKLSELGWVLEAQQEMQSFSWPQNALKVYYLSLILSKANLFPLSVRNVTPLLETYAEVRSINAIKEIYPKSYLDLILKEKSKYRLHEHLILSLIRQESSFGLKALSTSNAAGLMQMIQPTALEVAERLKMKIDFPDDLYRPEVNVPMGVFYIHQVIKEMSFNVPLGLAGYNAGPHKIKQFLNQREVTKKLFEGLPDIDYPGLEDLWIDELPWAETTGYVKSILRNTLIYELIDKGEIQYRPDFWRDFILK